MSIQTNCCIFGKQCTKNSELKKCICKNVLDYLSKLPDEIDEEHNNTLKIIISRDQKRFTKYCNEIEIDTDLPISEKSKFTIADVNRYLFEYNDFIVYCDVSCGYEDYTIYCITSRYTVITISTNKVFHFSEIFGMRIPQDVSFGVNLDQKSSHPFIFDENFFRLIKNHTDKNYSLELMLQIREMIHQFTNFKDIYNNAETTNSFSVLNNTAIKTTATAVLICNGYYDIYFNLMCVKNKYISDGYEKIIRAYTPNFVNFHKTKITDFGKIISFREINISNSNWSETVTRFINSLQEKEIIIEIFSLSCEDKVYIFTSFGKVLVYYIDHESNRLIIQTYDFGLKHQITANFIKLCYFYISDQDENFDLITVFKLCVEDYQKYVETQLI